MWKTKDARDVLEEDSTVSYGDGGGEEDENRDSGDLLDGNVLLRNDGNDIFTNVANSLGVEVNKICWGANFFDYDNDGFLDLFTGVERYNQNMANPPSGYYRNPLFQTPAKSWWK